MTRDEKGRFAKGESGNLKGRPKKATEEEYREAFCEIVPLERFKKMIEAQAKRADDGDLKAFEAIARYIAPPIQKSETELSGEIGVRYVDKRH